MTHLLPAPAAPASAPAPSPPDPLRHLYAHWARNCASSVEWLLGDEYILWFERRVIPVPYTMAERIKRADKYRKAAAYWQAKHVEANGPDPVTTPPEAAHGN